MNNFQKAFATVLNESSPSEDSDNFKKSLKDVDPKDFDIQPLPKVTDAGPKGLEEAKKWIEVIGKFADFLNGTDVTSIHSKINELDVPDSIWEGFSSAERKKIVSVATDLRNLQETLKSQIVSAHNRHTGIKDKAKKK
jgi:uncharacterized protein (DUF2344 family)